MDFACGSGSLLLKVRKKVNKAGDSGTIGKIFGQDKRARGQRRFGLAKRTRRVRRRGKPPKQKNIATYNLARMNMLLHGVKDTEFDILHGDTLLNEWDMMREANPAKKPSFDAIVALIHDPGFAVALAHLIFNFSIALIFVPALSRVESFLMAIITYGTGRASLLSGVVHLILLATWLFLILAP